MRSRRGVYSQSAQPMRDKATRELAGQARGKESSGVNVGNSNSDANNHTNPSASEPKKSASKLRRESRRKELFAHVRGCALESAPASVTATGETAAVGEFASEHPSSSSLRRLQLTGSDTSRSVSSSSLSLSGSESGTDSDCESQPPQPQSQPFGTSLYKEDVSDILSFGLALASLKSDDHHEDPTLLGSTTLKRNALLPLEPHTATTPATTSIPSLKQVAAASSPCFASPALPPITKPFAYASASASSTSSRTASNTPPASATMIASGKANSKTAAMEAHFFRALAESEIAIKTTLRRAADSLMSNDSGSSDSAGITPGFSFSSVPSVDLGESSAQTISSYSTTTPRPRFGNLTPTCHTTLLDRRNDALPFARFNNAEDEVLSSERLDQLLRNLERNALDGGDSTSLEIVEDDEEDDVDDEATEVESSIPWGAEGKKQVQPHLKPADVHAFRASTESLCSVDSFQTAYSATSVTLGPAARGDTGKPTSGSSKHAHHDAHPNTFIPLQPALTVFSATNASSQTISTFRNKDDDSATTVKTAAPSLPPPQHCPPASSLTQVPPTHDRSCSPMPPTPLKTTRSTGSLAQIWNPLQMLMGVMSGSNATLVESDNEEKAGDGEADTGGVSGVEGDSAGVAEIEGEAEGATSVSGKKKKKKKNKKGKKRKGAASAGLATDGREEVEDDTGLLEDADARLARALMEEDEALLGRNGAAGFEREFTLVGKGGRGQMAGSLTQGGHESRASSLVVGTSTAADGEGEKEGSASSGAVKLDPFPFSTTLVTKEPAEKEPTPPPVKKEPFPPWSEEPNEHTPTAHPQYKESGNLVFGIANSLDTSIFRDVALVGTKATSPLPPKQSASPIAPKKRENTSAVALKKREYVVQTLAETERILRPASVTASEQSVSNSMASEHHPRRTPTPVYPQRYTPTNTFIGNGSYHRNSPALSEQESLVDVPAWQRLVLSSGVSPVYYADLIDEVVRVMGYELFQIQRKPDVYMPVTSHPRRFHRSVDGEQTPFVPPCTKGSLHLYLKRTNKSMPLTPFAGLQHLRVCISRLQLERAQELNPPPINSRNRTITSETEIDRAANIPFEFFTAYREYEPLQSLIPGEMRNVGKSIYRQHRAESFGSYVFPSHEADSGAPVPQVVCVVARGGFGVPVLRTLTKMAGVSGTDGMEFLGMRYMQAMLPFQARIVTPYRVGDVKWAASVRFLAGPVRDVFGDGAVDGDAAFEEAESSTAEEVEEGGEGLMVIVLRKVNAFEEIQSVIASLFESYSSLGFKDARPENDNTLNPEEKMRLSLLVSLNPEMSYATLTAFFRDSDLIPAKWSCGGLTSPDDPEVVSNPGAIPMSLISPPRGHQALLVMKASAGWKCIAVLLQYLSSNGFVLSAFRHIIVGTATASKLVAVPDENVTQREGDEAVTAYIGEDGSVGVRMDGLASWITGAPVIVMVLWGVSASRRLNDLMAKFVIRPGIVKLPQKITDTVNRGETVLSSDVYVPSNYGVGQYQISVLCSKGLPVEIRDYPRQLGRFQRKIVTRRPTSLPFQERRLMANVNGQGLPSSPGTTLCTLFMLSLYPTIEANMIEWVRVLKTVMSAGLSSGTVAPKMGASNASSMHVVGSSYFVALEPLAEEISEVVRNGGDIERKSFSVHNILNGPCFAVVLEGGVELASNLRNATASLTPPTNDGNLFAILKHDECRALLPLIQSEMTSFAFRMAVLSAPHAPTSRTSSKVDG